MKARYQALSARALAIPDAKKPTVMTGRGTRGDFVIAGGRSYVAALIKDAGGRYVWADNTATGAPTIDLEAQLERAANADIWINGGGWPNRERDGQGRAAIRPVQGLSHRPGLGVRASRHADRRQRLLVARGVSPGPRSWRTS